MSVVTNLGRTAARAVGGLALDASHGVLTAAAGVRAAATGHTIGPATLRVHVVILSDETGRPLCAPEAVRPALQRADEVLRREAGIRVRVARLQVIDEPAPPRALDPRANQLLLLDDVLGRTEFYRRHEAPVDVATLAVGTPVTVVVVRRIAGRTTGCSLGISADWVIVQAGLFDAADPGSYDETVLVHELGHALNLPHRRDRRNLMFPESSPPDGLRGTALHPWQEAILHANRHVVPGVAQPR
ncbi:MAG TPA: zinc-dependent metalloprotease family protein [Nakamurella multipartita]|nr:zinc-dependent metalloprotease family protein [Nakamurella multipartita]